jgi:hypothetical protein
MINGSAKSVGFSNDKLPFPEVSAPTKRNNDIVEYMGFSYCLPCTDDVSNPTIAAGTNYTDLNLVEQDEEQANGDDEITDDLGDEFDIEVLLTETGYLEPTPENQREINNQLLLLENENIAEASDVLNSDLIQHELQKLLPVTTARESTLEAFQRLTEKNPWFPFRSPDSTSVSTDIDRAEAAYFERISTDFNRLADLDSPNGYKAFAREWNNEVSRRYKAWSTGDDDIIQLRLKKWEYLAEYYDKIEGHKALQASAPRDDEHRLRLRATLRDNRLQLPAVPTPFTVSPAVYQLFGITPFAAPTVLNPAIVVNAVTGTNFAATGHLNGRVVAPYQVQRPVFALPPPTARRMPVFRSRKYCVTCGWRRNQHQMGEGVANNCTRTFCGKCYQLKDHHGVHSFGPNCTNAVNTFCAVYVEEWYSP